MATDVLLYLVSALVCFVPGALLGFVVPPGRERWVAWASAPVLTLGLVSAGMAWLPVLGLPSAALWVLGAEIALAVLAIALTALAARRPWLAGRRQATNLSATSPAGELVVAARPAQAGTPAPPTQAAAGPATQAAASRDAGPAARRPWRFVTWRNWLKRGAQRQWPADLTAVSVSIAIAIWFGNLLLGPSAYPPGWDAQNHGLLTRNIIEAGSTAPAAVLTTGQPFPKLAYHFYPLAANVSWAQTAILSGAHISAVMLAWTMVIGPAALVMAIYAAVRAFGGGPVAASCAAITCLLASRFWITLISGRPPESVAPAMSTAIALLATLAIRGKHPVRMGLLAGMGLVGLVMTHTYDFIFAIVLTLAFLLAERTRWNWRRALAGLTAIVFPTVAASVPLAPALLAARAERLSSIIPLPGMSFGSAWHYWVTDFGSYVLLGFLPAGPSPMDIQPIRVALWLTLPCLLASPLCLVFKELRWARPWLLTWAAWTALCIWTSMSRSPAVQFLTSLWYGEPGRMRVMALPVNGVLAVAGACAIGLCLHRLVALAYRRARSARVMTVTASVTAAALAASLTGLGAQPPARAPLMALYLRREPVGPAYPRVFQWLARHTPPGKVVAYNRNVDFMMWSYADYGVPGLLGIWPRAEAGIRDSQTRQLMWMWLMWDRGARPAGCLVRKYRVEYAVTLAPGMHHMGIPVQYALAFRYSQRRVAESPNLTLVHSDGGINVYQVTPAGMACPSAAAR